MNFLIDAHLPRRMAGWFSSAGATRYTPSTCPTRTERRTNRLTSRCGTDEGLMPMWEDQSLRRSDGPRAARRAV